MTFGAYAKRQLWFEPVINSWDHLGDYTTAISGTLKSIRMRYIMTENFTDDFSLSIRLCSSLDPNEIIATSAALTLDDFTKPSSAFNFHQGWIRFDFLGLEVLSKDYSYGLYLNHSCSNYQTTDNKFIMFAIDSPLRTYTTSGNQNPFVNGYADIQIFLEGPYNDFVTR
jgi:hypothetical protein